MAKKKAKKRVKKVVRKKVAKKVTVADVLLRVNNVVDRVLALEAEVAKLHETDVKIKAQFGL